MPISTVLSFLLVGACWGCTTPFIKDGASSHGKDGGEASDNQHSGADGDGKQETRRLARLLAPLRSLSSMKAAVPFLLNQSGSVVYYYLLGSQDISMAVPVCSALTFVFTAGTAMLLGEKTDRPVRNMAGMVLVLVGIAVCVASKAS